MTTRENDPAVIGAETRVVGAVRGAELLTIEGRVDGPVFMEGAVEVAASGVVRGEVSAHAIVVAGIVLGDLQARDRLHLLPTAQVRGGLSAPKLRIEPGARVDGALHIGAAAAEPSEAARPRVSPGPGPEQTAGEPKPAERAKAEGEPLFLEERRRRIAVKQRP